MTRATTEGYAGVLSQRIAAEQRVLAAEWLDRLKTSSTSNANGSIRCESALGAGTTFSITLPCGR